MIATGIVGSSSGFLDLSNVVAIGALGIALVCSIIASITSLIYKLKMKQLMSNAHTIGFILGAALNLEGYLGIVFAIAVMGYFVLDAIEKK